MKPEPADKFPAERRSVGSQEYTKAMLNILDDFMTEKRRMEETQRAIFNILNDFMEEKDRLEETHRAVLNILDDFANEKGRLEDAQRAVLNILQDSTEEKAVLEEVRKAMLNLLEDFDVERSRTESANRELRDALDSVRRAKEAADAANTELQAFSYSVSHDLRAPLRALDGFSHALLEDYYETLDETGRDYLRRVRNASQKMAQLIDAMLKLSRLTRGELNIVPVNLSALARGIASDLRISDPGRSVEFRIAEGMSANADLNLIKVVLENMIGNAWKFTSKKNPAVIEIGAAELDGTAVYYVKDNGAGFDMKYADKLFGTFQRLHPETDYPGTGIGLSIIQRVISRHGGSVCAYGAPGTGATFYFSLDRPLREGCLKVRTAA